MRGQKLIRGSNPVSCGSFVSSRRGRPKGTVKILGPVILYPVFDLASLSANRAAYCHGPESLSILNSTRLAQLASQLHARARITRQQQVSNKSLDCTGSNAGALFQLGLTGIQVLVPS